jgi:hypothetical protein
MGIRLNIEITSPMDADVHELLSGIAVMTLAIANHELAVAKFPEAFGDEDGLQAGEPPASCGAVNPADAGAACVAEVAHKGRHTFRPVGAGPARAN